MMTRIPAWGLALGLSLSLGSVVAAAGCSGNVVTESAGAGGAGSAGPTTGTGPTTATGCDPGGCPAPCPASIPGDLAPCATDGQSCTYDGNGCASSQVTAACSSGAWHILGSQGCSNQPCPTERPVQGSPCDPCCDTAQCPYPTGTTCGPDYARCVGGSWSVIFPNCPAQPCVDRPTSDTCLTNPDCTWLVPGCGGGDAGALPVPPGCYDTADCTKAGCPNGGFCETVEFNPCWDKKCDLCSGTTQACVLAGAGGDGGAPAGDAGAPGDGGV